MGETLKETQNRRFKEQINEFLNPEFTKVKTQFDENSLLTKAKINHSLSLNKLQLNSLIFTADSWNQDIKLKRSGAGVLIEFNLNQ